jgi:predicted nucleotidyltransferase
MLKIVNNLAAFFEDCYREISVREYARIMKISPPTASKMLNSFVIEGLLKKREDRGFLLFRINRGNFVGKDLSRIYWNEKLFPLVNFLKNEIYSDSVVLFGSLSKLEVTKKSDIDLAIFTKSKKKIDLKKFEQKLKRDIQIFVFKNLEEIHEELRLNIINGYILDGYLE